MSYTYIGNELDLFAAATTWKSYFRRRIRPYLGAEVLEVGAGLGGTTRLLCRGNFKRWVCLEPDPALAARLNEELVAGRLPACCSLEIGALGDGPAEAEYDSILYMDVIEHIEDDAAELARAAKRLKPGGFVVVLSPAHNWLYTPFDKAIGHYRRYSKKTLKAISPPGLKLVKLNYMDSIGMFASIANKVSLKSASPNARQIAFWDKVMVRMSKVVDPVLGYTVGKSILGVWQRPLDSAAPGEASR
jgi:SAM-dependent methyltransferase